MRKIYFTILSIIPIIAAVQAQTVCSSGRYASDVYTTFTSTTNIVFGSNTTWSGGNLILKLDFYEPAADTCTARPLIIWAHGGSFLGGTSADADVVSLSQHFAKKGYACASINYRTGFYPVDSANAVTAVMRAVQDMKAAVRFFYKDKRTTNTYKIDTNNIFIGGSSAGAITALHMQYLDHDCEIYPYVNATKLAALGGIEGNSGNPGYSHKVNGVINLCGALAIYDWLQPGDLPFVSMHGTIDGTVKYNRGIVNPGVALMYLDGSRMLYEQSVALSLNSPFYTWHGADHVPYVNGGTAATQLAYMDTTVNFVRDYLLTRLGCSNPALQAPNTPAQTATLYSFSPCFIGIKAISNEISLKVYPNPSRETIKVVFENGSAKHTVQITDVAGRALRSFSSDQAEINIEKAELSAGMYLLKVSNSNGQSSLQKIMFY